MRGFIVSNRAIRTYNAECYERMNSVFLKIPLEYVPISSYSSKTGGSCFLKLHELYHWLTALRLIIVTVTQGKDLREKR